MEETIEAPDGGHYDKCGDMISTEESNKILRVNECTGCGHTRVQSSILTDMVLLVLTTVAAVKAVNTEFTAPADATATMMDIYPALGPIMGVLVMIIGAFCLVRLDQGVAFDSTGDQR